MIDIDYDVKLDYQDVMLVPQCSSLGPNSRAEVNLLNPDGQIGIIAANMDCVGTFEMAKELAKYKMTTALNKHYPVENLIDFYNNNMDITKFVIYSMGANDDDFMKYEDFIKGLNHNISPTVCIDVANGYTKETAYFIKYFKAAFKAPKIIAGNVVTPEGVIHLADAGADIIKIGIGPGGCCTTRAATGIGYPQFSAVLECKDYINGHFKYENIKIIADGGITCTGDIAKAFAAGANYVMIGSMLAGHDEGGGENYDENGRIGAYGTSVGYKITHKKFYGMASKMAQDKHNGGVAEYRASEGKDVLVPYKGPVVNTVKEILGGLRSSCAYQGVKNLSDISNEPKFILVNRQLNQIFS